MKFFFLVIVLFQLPSCMDQYNPYPYWKQFDQERETSVQNRSLLAENGGVPPKAGSAETIDQRYANLCASCHGPKGEGNGSASAGLNPKPRNFHDKAWQSKASDDQIALVIKSGGGAAGLSATMPPWGSQLNDDEIKKMVEMIRAWGK